MRHLKTTFCFTLMFSVFSFFIGCEYDAVLPEQPPPGVSFQDYIIPEIFNQGCNDAGCHGGPLDTPPDLTPGNAYNALWEGNYIDTMTPENSLLYRWMLGDEGLPMPLEGPNATYNAAILLWIEEGAQNN